MAMLGQRWTASWWVADGDRWRRPECEAAVRQRLVGDTPVVETSLRLAGGDARCTARAFIPVGASLGAVGVDITNDTPSPVAVALVIGPVSEARIEADSVLVDGAVVARFARRPAHWAHAPSADLLAALVTPTAEASGGVTFAEGGWIAVVSPLPHAATLELVVGAGLGSEFYPVPPSPEQVVAGWAAHAGRGAAADLADPNDALALKRARGLLATVALDDSTPLGVVAEVGRAAIRLDWGDRATAAAGLLADAQDRNGMVVDPSVTLASVDVWAGRWRLGVTVEEMEPAVLPLASALSALVGRRRRSTAVTLRGAADILARASATAAAIDQPSLARAFGDAAAQARPVDPPATAGTVGPWGVAHHADGTVDIVTIARSVTELIDGAVYDGGAVVDLCRGWRPDQAGLAIEARGVPTASGRISFAVRWHGRRPALLWEVDPWPGRSGDVGLVASVIDPTWSTTSPEGDALLAEPDALSNMTSIVGTMVDDLGQSPTIEGPGEGVSFS